jgi:hypothetical protein
MGKRTMEISEDPAAAGAELKQRRKIWATPLVIVSKTSHDTNKYSYVAEGHVTATTATHS